MSLRHKAHVISDLRHAPILSTLNSLRLSLSLPLPTLSTSLRVPRARGSSRPSATTTSSITAHADLRNTGSAARRLALGAAHPSPQGQDHGECLDADSTFALCPVHAPSGAGGWRISCWPPLGARAPVSAMAASSASDMAATPSAVRDV